MASQGMERHPHMWKLALIFAALIWGGSFVVLKDTLNVVGPAWIMTVRFGVAALVVGLLFIRRMIRNFSRDCLIAGTVLGTIQGTAFLVQNYGLVDTTPGRNAFLTATYCILVPFIHWAFSRQKPQCNSLIAGVLALVGVGFIALEEGFALALSQGDVLTIVSALLYALHMVLIPRYAKQHDVMTLTIIQLAVSAVISAGVAVSFEASPSLSLLFDPSVWFALFYLVVLSSCVCMVVQNLGQAHVPPAQAALILSLESVFAVCASVIFFNEEISLRVGIGFSTIFIAIVVSELSGLIQKRRASVELPDAS